MRLGRILRRWRLVSELSLDQVANEIGISKTTLSRLESGEGAFSAVVFLKVMNWLAADELKLVRKSELELEPTESEIFEGEGKYDFS